MNVTKGKWEIHDGFSTLYVFSGVYRIADIPTTGTLTDTERLANARLIAAAPDLLAACKMADACIVLLLQHCRENDCEFSHDFSAPKMLKEAIAKANKETK